MIAIDTNVVVRLLTADDPEQTRRARELVANHPIWVGKTVVLETEWVLRFCYQLERADVNRALRSLAGLPQVSVEHPECVALALQWHEGGLDFADALHLASAGSATCFATFDQALVRRAPDGIAIQEP